MTAGGWEARDSSNSGTWNAAHEQLKRSGLFFRKEFSLGDVPMVHKKQTMATISLALPRNRLSLRNGTMVTVNTVFFSQQIFSLINVSRTWVFIKFSREGSILFADWVQDERLPASTCISPFFFFFQKSGSQRLGCKCVSTWNGKVCHWYVFVFFFFFAHGCESIASYSAICLSLSSF